MSRPAIEQELTRWLTHAEQTHPSTIKMGLDRVSTVAKTLGLDSPAAHVITVAGTNGKGSTAVAAEALLRRWGYSVGCTLSPHLWHFSERVRIQGQAVASAQICAAFAAIERARGDVLLTYFEFAALVALWCFREAAVDVIVLEIGLGGRLDAFNLVSADCVAITSIGLDHQSYLGSDREAIGAEKAGVLRSNQRVVLGPDMPASVLARCRELGLRPLEMAQALRLEKAPAGWRLYCSQAEERWSTPILAHGELVTSNCALALAAVWPLLIDRQDPEFSERLRQWSKALSLPGRRQRLVCDGREWLLDVGHNPLAAAALAEHLTARFPERRVIAVFGAFADKDCRAMAAALAERVVHWVLVPSKGERGQTSAALAAQLSVRVDRQGPLHNLHQARSVAQGMRLARGLAEPADLTLVWGGFAVVAAALAQLGEQNRLPDQPT